MLDRAEALNALSFEMVLEITKVLQNWASDDSVAAILFIGAGDRAFCAGGDIRTLYYAGIDYQSGAKNSVVPVDFFAKEYAFNQYLFHYPKITIAYMDGIVMGGGYGIAGHCDVRIVNDNTLFAMPETGIGFFPDVGSLYHLLKCPHNYGRYLALTGARINGRACVAAGLADVFVQGVSVVVLKDIVRASSFDKAGILKMLTDYSVAVDQAEVTEIEALFSDCDVEAIFARLRGLQTDEAVRILDELTSKAPLSVCVTAEYLKRAADFSFDQVIEMDFALAQAFVRSGDLYEGIRAQVIDKDRNPQWQHKSIHEVARGDVEVYFEPARYALRAHRIFST